MNLQLNYFCCLHRKIAISLLLIVNFHVGDICADDDFFTDIDISVDAHEDRRLKSKWSIKQLGSYGLANPSSGFARSESGLNKMETSLHAEFDARFSPGLAGRLELELLHDAVYALNSDINASENELDTFKNRYEARDIYLDIELSKEWNLRAGNQIIAWGQAETLVISDLIAPHNNYTLLQADLEDIRLHVPALKLTRSDSNFTLDTVITYDAGFNYLAPEGNEFDPFIQLRELPLALHQHKASRRSEYFVRLKRNFKGGDISLIAADANNNELSLAHTTAEAMHFSQKRFQALGLSGSYSAGLWIYKAELGAHWGKPVTPATSEFMNYLQGWEKRDQSLAMMGFDYAGFGDATVSLEINYVHTRGATESLAIEEIEMGATTSVNWSDENQKLTLNAHVISLLNSNGTIFRANAEYALTDSLKIGALLVTYDAQENDSLYLYRNNDAVQFHLQYYF
jgi:hypothetical protein